MPTKTKGRHSRRPPGPATGQTTVRGRVAESHETLKRLPWLVTNGDRRVLIRALVVTFSARPEITEHQRRRVLEQSNARRCLPPLEHDELTRIDAECALVGVTDG